MATTGEGRRAHLPVLLSLHQQFSPGVEVVAALTLLVIAVPEQLATSRLAGMPPITGLYAFVAGTVAFVVLGSNPQMSVGADSTIAPLFAAALSRLAPQGSAEYAAMVGILAVCVGVLVAAVGVLRLGFVAEFLSSPIITGFLAGVAVIIVVHQLPDVLGLPAASGGTVHRLESVVRHLGHVNVPTLLIALFVFAAVEASERVDRRIPGALVGLVASTVAVAAWHLHAHGVAVLGSVAHSAPAFGLRGLSWASLGRVLPVSAVVALVVVAQSAATSRAFADRGRYDVDIGRDFVGVGAGSVLAGLSGSFAVDASPARTAAVASSGGRTQLTGLLAAGAVVLLVPAAGVLHDVPLATLGAILVFVATRIFHGRDLAAIARFGMLEFGLALVTLLAVAVVGVEPGIALAVGLAILDRTRLSARPRVHRLGRIPGTTSWAPVETEEHAEEVPGVTVLLFAASLSYMNAMHFREEIGKALGEPGAAGNALVLDVVGMYDLDFTGSRVLGQLLDELDTRHVTVGLARAGNHLRGNLDRSGLLDRIGTGRLYPSVDAAVAAFSPPAG